MDLGSIQTISQEIFLSDMSATLKKRHYSKKYATFADAYPFLFNKCCESTDLATLEYMITMLKNVQDNKITDTVATASVGQKLFDDYVKPVLDAEGSKK
jgi:hypothetical protein